MGEQDEKGEPSREHLKVTPVCGSVNRKVAEVEPVGLAGDEVIVGDGGATAHWYRASELACVCSRASTLKMWLPSARFL